MGELVAFETRSISAPFGIEAVIDPHAPLDDADQLAFKDLFYRHHLVVVHSDGMSAAEAQRLCGYVADVLVEEGVAPEAYVSSARGDAVLPDVEIPWHTDMNFNEHPHIGASLYAEEVDEQSSPTWFASATRPVDLLPPDLRSRIEPIVGLHELPALPRDDGTRSAGDGGITIEPTRHPLLWAHPVTGEPLLYVSGRQAQQARVFEGIDEDEERALLAELFSYLYAPDNVYEHSWQVGDLVIWDNLAVQHRRAKVAGRRTIRRLALVLPGEGEGDQYFRIQAFIKATRGAPAPAPAAGAPAK